MSELHHEKIPTQTRLYSERGRLEARNLKKDCTMCIK